MSKIDSKFLQWFVDRNNEARHNIIVNHIWDKGNFIKEVNNKLTQKEYAELISKIPMGGAGAFTTQHLSIEKGKVVGRHDII